MTQVLGFFLLFAPWKTLHADEPAAAATYLASGTSPSAHADAELKIHYQMTCLSGVRSAKAADPSSPPALIATAKIRQEGFRKTDTLLFLLPQGPSEFSLLLGPSAAAGKKIEVEISFEANSKCSLNEKTLRFEIRFDDYENKTIQSSSKRPTAEEWQWISKKFAPLLLVRDDQYKVLSEEKRVTDWALTRGFDYEDLADGRYKIRYTEFFTDEDSIQNTKGIEEQMTRYGRHTDIEFSISGIIQIGQDGIPAWEKDSIQYHGALPMLGFGHASRSFQNGIFLKPGNLFLSNDGDSTSHPVLFIRNSPKNNTFSDTPNGPEQKLANNQSKGWTGFFHAPIRIFKNPEAREILQFENPWITQISDWEAQVEGKLARSSTDYLYVRIRGELPHGAFKLNYFPPGELNHPEKNRFGSVDRLGEDLFNRESFTAIPLQSESQILEGGTLQIEEASTWVIMEFKLDPSNPTEYWKISKPTNSPMRSEKLDPSKFLISDEVIYHHNHDTVIR